MWIFHIAKLRKRRKADIQLPCPEGWNRKSTCTARAKPQGSHCCVIKGGTSSKDTWPGLCAKAAKSAGPCVPRQVLVSFLTDCYTLGLFMVFQSSICWEGEFGSKIVKTSWRASKMSSFVRADSPDRALRSRGEQTHPERRLLSKLSTIFTSNCANLFHLEQSKRGFCGSSFPPHTWKYHTSTHTDIQTGCSGGAWDFEDGNSHNAD